MLVDSHCHLDFECYKGRIDEIVAEANVNGIGCMLSISTSEANCKQVIQIAQKYQNVFASVGVHPLNVETGDIISIEKLMFFAMNPKVIAFGETGLDFFKNINSKSDQLASLERHIIAAQNTGLPIIIHTREADSDTIAMLISHYKHKPFKGVIHCFTASRTLAFAMLDIGFFISVSGIITFKNAEEIRNVIADVPLNRLLVETDAPFLAPVPHRGKENKPAYVRHTADFLANLKDISPDELYTITTNNFFCLFDKAKAYISDLEHLN